MGRILGILFLLSFTLASYGQTLTDLNNEKDAILSLIEESNKLLTDYSDKKTSELMQISVIDDKIAKRKRLINIYNNQIFAYTSQIKTLIMQLDSLENEIFRLKEDYSKIIYQQSINKMDRNGLVYLLSSKSFNESYRRFLFMRQYNDYRKQQAEQIKVKKEFFNKLKENVIAKREQLDKILLETKRESTNLEYELSQRQSKVQQFTQQQSNLTQQIADAEKKKKELEEMIVAMIQEEARKARENGANQMLSSDINQNKGLLPWPCDKYVVVSNFGEHEHPLVPSLTIRNNGIDIDVLDSKKIHPIHEGKVSKIIIIPGSNASVIVRHGNILTVYSNLSEVSVKKDETVFVTTELGKVYSGSGINSNVLHFELWNSEEKQNPLDWLQKY
ncbi:MAG: peptidoglycan DD-metalloendopeptidase family protein [Bacteroidales bacterium]|nr:peptidoglycan DD-metalloendopeptidase family protein [Bacteroidales bacterium]